MSEGYFVRHIRDVEPVPCPCGSSFRFITRQEGPLLNFHVTHIMDSRKHYHKEATEVYYILEGSGHLELNDEVIELEPGMAIRIEPGVAHRGYGDFKTIVLGVPAMNPDDEFFAEEEADETEPLVASTGQSVSLPE